MSPAPRFTHTGLALFTDPESRKTESQSRKELINICTRGTDDMHNVPYRCPACSGCKQFQDGAKLGLASSVSIQEQQDIQSIIHFEEPDPPQPCFYISKLPLLPDYKNHVSSNYDGVDLANMKMLQQLQTNPGDAEEV